jgi:TIR domain
MNAPDAPTGSEPVASASWTAKDAMISYAQTDRATADELCRLLEARGIRCWIAPRDIPAGVEWAVAIDQAIEAAPCTIVLLSAAAEASVWVQEEVQRAFDNRRPIVPVRLEDRLRGPALELLLGDNGIDAWAQPLEGVADRLASVVRSLVVSAHQLNSQAAATADRHFEAAQRVEHMLDQARADRLATARTADPRERLAFTAAYPGRPLLDVWYPLTVYLHLDRDEIAKSVKLYGVGGPENP